jgi:hypothetical protein
VARWIHLNCKRKSRIPKRRAINARIVRLQSPLRHTEPYLVENSETSADELALTSSSVSYPVKEPENSADELVFASFSHPIEDEVLADELSVATDAKPTASKKRPVMGLEKILS